VVGRSVKLVKPTCTRPSSLFLLLFWGILLVCSPPTSHPIAIAHPPALPQLAVQKEQKGNKAAKRKKRLDKVKDKDIQLTKKVRR
jgi:hypothetical protein